MDAPEFVLMARSQFDRVAEHRGDQAWLDEAWQRAKILLVSPASTTPVRADGPLMHLQFTTAADVPAEGDRWFLGVADDVPYFAVVAEPTDESWVPMFALGLRVEPLELDLFVTALGLTQWHARHGRCALCGEPTRIEQGGWIRRCPADDSQHFPRTDPAVIMLIHDGGDRCLLGRGVNWPAGRFSTLAGFVEPGESLEAAVIREVFEEVAVKVTDVRYVASQPWPFPSSLMLGFSARVDGDGAVAPDLVEMAEAGWFTREEVQHAADWIDEHSDPDPSVVLGAVSSRVSISRFLIDQWLNHRLPD